MRPQVVAVGNANVDITCFVTRIPEPDADVFAENFHVGAGGSAANFAVASKRLGAEAYVVAVLGRDLLSEIYLRSLRRSGVNTDGLIRADLPTGIVLILHEKGAQRRMITFRGANALLNEENLRKKENLLKSCDLVHVTSVMRTSLEAVLRIVKGISWDPGIKIIHEVGTDILRYLKDVRRLFVNLREAQLMTGESDPVRAAKFLARFSEEVVVKLGSQGAIACSKGKIFKERAFEVEVLDTTGAGDAFAAAYSISRLRGRDVREALVHANAVAALKITRIGAQEGLPSWDEVMDFLRRWNRG